MMTEKAVSVVLIRRVAYVGRPACIAQRIADLDLHALLTWITCLQVANPETGEVYGPRGKEPTRFGTCAWAHAHARMCFAGSLCCAVL